MTSIDWLVEKVNSDCLNSTFIRKELIDEAKEMHKQEIIQAHDMGYIDGGNHKKFTAEMYYEETFVSKGSDFKQFSLYEYKDTITSADTPVFKTFLESVPKQETLYTEEQLDKAISWGINSGRKGDVTITDIDNFIKSLKQPKKD
jgi:hypothetical protein